MSDCTAFDLSGCGTCEPVCAPGTSSEETTANPCTDDRETEATIEDVCAYIKQGYGLSSCVYPEALWDYFICSWSDVCGVDVSSCFEASFFFPPDDGSTSTGTTTFSTDGETDTPTSLSASDAATSPSDIGTTSSPSTSGAATTSTVDTVGTDPSLSDTGTAISPSTTTDVGTSVTTAPGDGAEPSLSITTETDPSYSTEDAQIFFEPGDTRSGTTRSLPAPPTGTTGTAVGGQCIAEARACEEADSCSGSECFSSEGLPSVAWGIPPSGLPYCSDGERRGEFIGGLTLEDVCESYDNAVAANCDGPELHAYLTCVWEAECNINISSCFGSGDGSDSTSNAAGFSDSQTNPTMPPLIEERSGAPRPLGLSLGSALAAAFVVLLVAFRGLSMSCSGARHAL